MTAARRRDRLGDVPGRSDAPSEMTGTSASRSACATKATAEICGTPTPATMRVVQIRAGPMPTLTASAPAIDQRLRSLGSRDVAAITWLSAHFA